MTYGNGEPTAEEQRAWRGFLLPLGALLALFGVALAIWFVFNKQASADVAAILYQLIGDSDEAARLRAGSGNLVAAKIILAAVALALGIGGIWLFYAGLNYIVMGLSARWRGKLLPWVFVGPALAMLTVYLVWPLVRTMLMSLTEGDGVSNWQWALTDPANHQMYINNVLWLVVGVAGAVGLGLLVAGLMDRIKHESVGKMFVFLPLAISLVGASVIWRFVYWWRPEGANQIGLLNAIWTGLGQEPVAWYQTPDYRLNTFALIVILIWLQTGFAMVVLSAAIKGVPTEIIEAAGLDGASERQKFLNIIVPMIRGSLIMVTITTSIVVLKVFDIVFTMTGGKFNTDVIANQMYTQAFLFFNDGRGAVLATILFLAVLPMALINVRNIRKQGMAA
ncbi:MAG: sugar ABC transporter permease [Chloroflexota bacterium]|nr:sugar ABC transporter permease [Chloroflexota bacterium]